jgi:hypothetical protein
VRFPFATVHTELIGGTDVTRSPFGVFGMHTFCAHQSLALQSLSLVHEDPQAPTVALHLGPAWVPTVQSASIVHLPHWPWFVPLVKQNGALTVAHDAADPLPKSPPHGTHAPPAQTGLPAVGHAVGPAPPNPPVQASQNPVPTSHTGAEPVHCASTSSLEKQKPPGFGAPSVTPAVPAVAPRASVAAVPGAPAERSAVQVFDLACTKTRPPAPPPPGAHTDASST